MVTGLQTIAFAVAGAAAAVGLAKAAPGRARSVIALVVIFALARLVISWFPMDEPGSERTNHGTMHGLIAIVTFIAIAAAAGRLGSIAKQVPGWTTLATVSSLIAWLMVASLIAMMVVVRRGARVTHSTPQYFGAIERVFYLALVAWFVLVAVGLM